MPKLLDSKTVAVSKDEKSDLKNYLEYADLNHRSINTWGVVWKCTHGETRSESRNTFHIGGRLVQQRYESSILLLFGGRNIPVEGGPIGVRTRRPSIYKAVPTVDYSDFCLKTQCMDFLLTRYTLLKN